MSPRVSCRVTNQCQCYQSSSSFARFLSIRVFHVRLLLSLVLKYVTLSFWSQGELPSHLKTFELKISYMAKMFIYIKHSRIALCTFFHGDLSSRISIYINHLRIALCILFHRDLSSNAITYLPINVFGNLIHLTEL